MINQEINSTSPISDLAQFKQCEPEKFGSRARDSLAQSFNSEFAKLGHRLKAPDADDFAKMNHFGYILKSTRGNHEHASDIATDLLYGDENGKSPWERTYTKEQPLGAYFVSSIPLQVKDKLNNEQVGGYHRSKFKIIPLSTLKLTNKKNEENDIDFSENKRIGIGSANEEKTKNENSYDVLKHKIEETRKNYQDIKDTNNLLGQGSTKADVMRIKQKTRSEVRGQEDKGKELDIKPEDTRQTTYKNVGKLFSNNVIDRLVKHQLDKDPNGIHIHDLQSRIRFIPYSKILDSVDRIGAVVHLQPKAKIGSYSKIIYPKETVVEDHPRIAALKQLIKENKTQNMVELGKKYGVSKQAIAARLKTAKKLLDPDHPQKQKFIELLQQLDKAGTIAELARQHNMTGKGMAYRIKQARKVVKNYNRNENEQSIKFTKSSFGEAVNTEVNKVADRLHKKHGVSDIDKFKQQDHYANILNSVQGDQELAADAATHILYGNEGIGQLEKEHKPNTPLSVKMHFIPKAVKLHQIVSQRRQLAGMPMSNLTGEKEPEDFAEESNVSNQLVSKPQSPFASKKDRSAQSKQTVENRKALPTDLIDSKFLEYLKNRPEGVTLNKLRNAFKLPSTNTIEALNRIKPAIGSKRKGRQVTKLYFHPSHLPTRADKTEQYAAVKPKHGDFNNALRLIKSQGQQQKNEMVKEIAKRVGASTLAVRPAIHDSPDTASVGVAHAIQHNSLEQAALTASWSGLLSQARSLCLFNIDPQGPDSVYRTHVTGSGEKLRDSLDAHGINQRLLIPTTNGYSVMVFDPGSKIGGKMRTFAQINGVKLQTYRGNGTVIGDSPNASADSDTRANYRSIINHIEEGNSLNANPPNQSANS